MAKRLSITSLKGSWLLSCFKGKIGRVSNKSNSFDDDDDEMRNISFNKSKSKNSKGLLSLDIISTSSLDSFCIVDPMSCDYVVDNDDVLDENGCLRAKPSNNINHRREASSVTLISSFSLDDDADDG